MPLVFAGLALALTILLVNCTVEKPTLVQYEFECKDVPSFKVCRYETKDTYFLGEPWSYTTYFDCKTKKDIKIETKTCVRREL